MAAAAAPPPRISRVGAYRLGKTLGIGSFCKVKLATHEPTSQKVAVKILNRKKLKKQDMGEKVRTEIHILRMFTHPHIIRLYEVIDTATDIFTIMEYVPGGELFDYIVSKGKLDEKEARSLFQQIISGVEYCHVHQVVHRDLKPENLLLDADNRIKIADFGLSNRLRDGLFLKTSCGSPNYAAPEVISGNLYCGPEVDVWSCGVILYALLCGSLPFDDENIRSLFRKIKNGIYTIPSHVPQGARELITQMLIVDPLKRITLQAIMAHPWYRTNLPAYLAVSAEQQIERAQLVDEAVVQRVVNMGFSHEKILRSLAAGVELTTSRAMAHYTEARKIAVIYNLLRDQKRRKEQKDDDVRVEEPVPNAIVLKDSANNITDPSEIDTSIMSPVALSTHNGILLAQTNHQQQARSAHAASGMESFNSNHLTVSSPIPFHPRSPSPNPLNANGSNFTIAVNDLSLNLSSSVRGACRWKLGKYLTDEPQKIMTQLYATLTHFNFEWKVISLYRVKARFPAGLVDRNGRPVGSNEVVKLGFQLYRVGSSISSSNSSGVPSPSLHPQNHNSNTQSSNPPSSSSHGSNHNQPIHVLDIHKLYGQMFLCFELCSYLLTQLRAVLH